MIKSLVLQVVIIVAAITAAAASAAEEPKVTIGGAGPLIGTMELLAEAYNRANPGRKVEVVPRDEKTHKVLSMTSQGGIKAAIQGTFKGGAFIGFSSDRLTDEQRKMGAQALEVARVALVFVVAEKNAPVDNLTTQQVIAIYARKMREWRPGLPIRLVRRPLAESDNTILMENIPQLKPLIADLLDPNSESGRGLELANDAQENANYIEQDEQHPGALGTSSTNMLITEKRALKALKLDGVDSSAANILSGRYPLQKSVFVVTGKTVTPEMRDFIAFVERSKASRDIFTKTGHVFIAGSGIR
jgi:phosphate transport system substrate-binding protein